MSGKFEHKKSLGQHFLTSEIVPGWMCDAADLREEETVLEIGPGTGVLTAELLKRGVKVIAVEADQRAIAELEERFMAELASGQLSLHHSDARELNLEELGLSSTAYKIVANIPYYLSGLLFRTCLTLKNQPKNLVFLVQKEVAKRATTGIEKGAKESLLSLSIKAYGQPKYVKTVGRGHFVPPPKVDSGIIAITNISRDNFKAVSEDLFFQLLHLGFGQKRKQLLGNLSQVYDRTELTNIFSTLNIPLSTRAEDLPLEKWLALVDQVSSLS